MERLTLALLAIFLVATPAFAKEQPAPGWDIPEAIDWLEDLDSGLASVEDRTYTTEEHLLRSLESYDVLNSVMPELVEETVEMKDEIEVGRKFIKPFADGERGLRQAASGDFWGGIATATGITAGAGVAAFGGYLLRNKIRNGLGRFLTPFFAPQQPQASHDTGRVDGRRGSPDPAFRSGSNSTRDESMIETVDDIDTSQFQTRTPSGRVAVARA